MDARLISEADVTVPLLGRGLGVADIVADPEFAALIRFSFEKIAGVVAERRLKP
jgi:hypothetical protein